MFVKNTCNMNRQLRLLQFALMLAGFGFFALRLQGQCTPFSYALLDANKVVAPIHNRAELFWGVSACLGYQAPKGVNRYPILSHSLWAGGMDPQGGLHVAAGFYAQGRGDFYAGPYRKNFAYNCGKGFDTPVNCFNDGALALSDGRVLTLYPQGFQVYDPQTQTSLQRILPGSYQHMRAVELPSGFVVLLNWGSNANQPSEVLVLEPSNFSLPTPDTLLYQQFGSTMVVLSTGNVLLIGPYGVEEFDPVTHTSQARANNGTQWQKHDAIKLPNGKVLVVGQGGSNNPQIYDPVLNVWQAGPNTIYDRRFNPQLTQLPNGKILISGGNELAPQVEYYDPQTNQITIGPSLPDTFRLNQAYVIGPEEVVFAYERLFETTEAFVFNLVDSSYRMIPLRNIGVPAAFDGTALIANEFGSTRFDYIDVRGGTIVDQRWQHVWKVTRAQRQQFELDFANGNVNFDNYPDIETWPGNGNIWAGEDAQLAPYVDVDNDGVYDPTHDGDYPCFVGDQALWWVYNDDGEHHESQGAAFPLQVEAMAYAFDCDNYPCPDTALDYATFYHYEITNKSELPYHDLRIGLFDDIDIGNYYDDYVGADTNLHLAFGYNGDANDETSSGYGLNPPAFGSLLLPNGQIDEMDGMMTFANDFSSRGIPETPTDYYGYLKSQWKDGSHLTYNGTQTNVMFPGDPGWCGSGGNGGWSEIAAGSAPYDRRIVQSFGPFNLGADATLELDFAMVYSRAYYNDQLGSVCQLQADAAVIQDWWQNTLDRGCFSLVTAAPRPMDVAANKLKIVPNPNGGLFALQLENMQHEALAIELLNLQGQRMLHQTLDAGATSLTLDARDFPKGIYILRVNGKSGAATEKIVIQ
jgi:hypothetical protein